MKEQLLFLRENFLKIRKLYKDAEKNVDNIRTYYKFQNEETDSASLNLIQSYSYFDEIDHAIECIDMLIDFEEEYE